MSSQGFVEKLNKQEKTYAYRQQSTHVYCWGSNQQSLLCSSSQKCLTYPHEIVIKHNVVDIAASEKHISFVTKEGQVYSYGVNLDGRLGIGGQPDLKRTFESPSLVRLPAKASRIKCGFSHVCVQLANNELYAWGLGEYGSLGTGEFKSRSVPTHISLPMQIKDFSCGAMHSAFVDDLGQIYTCGSNQYGELGMNKPEKIAAPTLVNFNQRAVKVQCGVFYTLILTNKRQVFGMGNNKYGQLGMGHKINECRPTLLRDLRDIVSIAAGYHSGAIDAQGYLYLWGSGGFGELLRPKKYTLDQPIVSLHIRGFFGVALSLHKVYSWGNNASGELGRNEIQASKQPTEIETLNDVPVQNVACGASFVLATLSNAPRYSPQPLLHRTQPIKLSSLSRQGRLTTELQNQLKNEYRKELRQQTKSISLQPSPHQEQILAKYPLMPDQTPKRFSATPQAFSLGKQSVNNKHTPTKRNYEQLFMRLSEDYDILFKKYKVIEEQLSYKKEQRDDYQKAELKKIILTYETNQTQMRAQIDVMRKIQDNSSAEIAALKNQLYNQQQENKILFHNVSVDNKLIQEKLKATYQEYVKVKAQLIGCQTILQKQKIDFNQKQHQNQQLKKDVINYQYQSSNNKIALKNIQTQILKYKKENQSLQIKLKQKQRSQNNGFKNQKEFNQQKQHFQIKIDEFKKQKQLLQIQNERVKKQYQLNKKQIEILKRQNNVLQKQIEGIKMQNESSNKNGFQKRQYDILKKHSEQRKAQTDKLNKQLNNCKKEIEMLEGQLKEEKKTLTQLMLEKDTEMKTLMVEKEAIQKELRKLLGVLQEDKHVPFDHINEKVLHQLQSLNDLRADELKLRLAQELSSSAFLKHQYAVMGAKCEQYCKIIEELQIQKQGQNSVLHKQQNDLIHNFAALEDKINTLQYQLMFEKQFAIKCEETLTDLKEERDGLTQQNEQLIHQLKLQKQKHRQINNTVQKSKKKEKQLEMQLKEEQKQKNELKENYSRQRNQFEHLLTQKQTILAEIKQQLFHKQKQLENSIDNNEKISEETDKQIKILQKQIKTKVNQIIQLKRELQLKDIDISNLNQNAMKLQKKLLFKTQQLQTQTKQQQLLSQQVLNLKKQCTALKTKNSAVQQNVEDEKEKKNKLQQKCIEYQNKMTQLKEQISKKNGEMSNLREQSVFLREELQSTQQATALADQLKNELLRANKQFAQNEQVLNQKINELNAKLEELYDENRSYTPRYEALMQRNKQLDQRNNELSEIVNKAIQMQANNYKMNILKEVNTNTAEIVAQMQSESIYQQPQRRFLQQGPQRKFLQEEAIVEDKSERQNAYEEKDDELYKQMVNERVNAHRKRISQSAHKLADILDMDGNMSVKKSSVSRPYAYSHEPSHQDYQQISQQMEALSQQKSQFMRKINDFAEKLKIL